MFCNKVLIIKRTMGILALILLAFFLSQTVWAGGTKESSVTTSGQQPEKFSWKRWSGQTVSIWIHDAPSYTSWVRKVVIPEFEELTGMKVIFESTAVNAFRTKQPIELAARSDTYAVMDTMTVVEGRKYAQAGWYEPLDKYIQNSKLTAPDWDWVDFSDGARISSQIDGETYAVPYVTQTLVLFYRKDLFDKYNVKVPNTFEELETAAAALHLKEPGVYGIAVRGGGYQMTTPFSAFLYGMGGSWLKKGEPALTTPEALKAFELYGNIGHNYGPPGAPAFSYAQVVEGFSQGKLAMTIDINQLAAKFDDPEKSKVVGKVGYALVPAGPAGRKPFVAGWGYMINPFSSDADKEKAWYLIQFITSKENMLEEQLMGYPTPRISVWESSTYEENDPRPQFSEVVQESFKIGHPYMNPPVVAGLEARKIVGVVGDLVLGGASFEEIKAAAEKANLELTELIKRTE